MNLQGTPLRTDFGRRLRAAWAPVRPSVSVIDIDIDMSVAAMFGLVHPGLDARRSR